MIIRQAEYSDITAINHLAHETWWPTYTDVIPDEQIRFMLEDMYSEQALKQQIESGITFLLAESADKPIGFAAFSLTEPAEHVFKLQKLYVLPAAQGMGIGKKLLAEVTNHAKKNQGKILELNVNRKNPAFEFYKRLGFEIYQTVDIPYNQFVLNDYVMRKAL
jgi:diamine N-acetyltransferase